MFSPTRILVKLTTPDHPLFFPMLGGGIQNDLLHHFSRDGGDADCFLVVPLVLLSLFEDD